MKRGMVDQVRDPTPHDNFGDLSNLRVSFLLFYYITTDCIFLTKSLFDVSNSLHNRNVSKSVLLQVVRDQVATKLMGN